MQRSYWDKISVSYDDEVFDVFSNDKKHLILNLIKKYGNTDLIAGDIGCGTGRFLPALSESFKEVFALDISPHLIRRAKSVNDKLKNITYLQRDLASPSSRLPTLDFALSVNAFLDPSLTRRNRMLDNVCDHLSPRGIFLLIVPSVESKILTDQKLIEWNLHKGLKGSAAVRTGADDKNRIVNNGLHQGIVLIDGVATKHYLREELIFMLEKRRLTIKQIKKIEYPWSIEFSQPPVWMDEPFPWDWLVLSQKMKSK